MPQKISVHQVEDVDQGSTAIHYQALKKVQGSMLATGCIRRGGRSLIFTIIWFFFG